ncbi:MAG: hypothetical protein IJZ96_06250, partial [Lachnospiraceae bacterium]|nr:hypothetical protein [Lachnospiraceae bacterium]
AYKWCNDEYLQEILQFFENSLNDEMMRAAKAFKKRQEEGRLPERLDPEHKVAKFVNGYYTEHRYTVG